MHGSLQQTEEALADWGFSVDEIAVLLHSRAIQ